MAHVVFGEIPRDCFPANLLSNPVHKNYFPVYLSATSIGNVDNVDNVLKKAFDLNRPKNAGKICRLIPIENANQYRCDASSVELSQEVTLHFDLTNSEFQIRSMFLKHLLKAKQLVVLRKEGESCKIVQVFEIKTSTSSTRWIFIIAFILLCCFLVVNSLWRFLRKGNA